MGVRTLVLWGLATSARATASCSPASVFAGYSANDQKVGAWKERSSQVHLLCESQNMSSTTEIQRGNLGVKTGWQSSSGAGQVNFMVTHFMGQSVSGGEVVVDPNYTSHIACGTGDGSDPWLFQDLAVLQNRAVPGSLNMQVWAFKNNAVKAQHTASLSQFTMDLGDMGGCKTDVILEMVVPASRPSNGLMELSLEVKLHHDTQEQTLNEGLSSSSSTSSAVVILDGSGNGVLSFAKTFICKNGMSTVSPTINEEVCGGDGAGCRFKLSVPYASVSSCQSLYWDPVITPRPCLSSSCRAGWGSRAYATSSANSAGKVFGVLMAIPLLAARLQ